MSIVHMFLLKYLLYNCGDRRKGCSSVSDAYLELSKIDAGAVTEAVATLKRGEYNFNRFICMVFVLGDP